MATKPFRSSQTHTPPKNASNNVNGKCDFLISFLSCFPPLDRGKLGILHFLSKWTKRTENHPKKSNFTFVILKDMLNTHCETSWNFPFFLYFCSTTEFGTSRPSRRRFGVVSFLTRVVSGLAHSRVTFSIINSKCQVYTVNAQSICLPRVIRPIPIGQLY